MKPYSLTLILKSSHLSPSHSSFRRMSTRNAAVFLLEAEGPWTLKEAIYYPPEAGQVVIKNGAIAISPCP